MNEKQIGYELRKLKRQICCILENGGSSGGNQNLQQVTDVGNTTNNSLLVIPTNVDKEISIVNTQTVANIFGNLPQGGVKLILSDKVVGDDEFIGTIELINNLGYSAILSPQLIDGDIIIKGIVGKNYNNERLNYIELKRVKYETINEIASRIIVTITPMLV